MGPPANYETVATRAPSASSPAYSGNSAYPEGVCKTARFVAKAGGPTVVVVDDKGRLRSTDKNGANSAYDRETAVLPYSPSPTKYYAAL